MWRARPRFRRATPRSPAPSWSAQTSIGGSTQSHLAARGSPALRSRFPITRLSRPSVPRRPVGAQHGKPGLDDPAPGGITELRPPGYSARRRRIFRVPVLGDSSGHPSAAMGARVMGQLSKRAHPEYSLAWRHSGGRSAEIATSSKDRVVRRADYSDKA